MPCLTCRPEIAALVPEALAREAGAFPLDFSDDVFTFAAGGPLPDDIEEKLRFVLGREIQVVIHPEEAIRQALDDCYGVGNEVEVSLFYFRECARILDSGEIEISVSGWESGQGRIGHWTGWESFAPDNPDYPLWTWILAQGERFPKIIGPTELEAIREAFRGA